eukprot:261472-Hanusia_phi.AAC.1
MKCVSRNGRIEPVAKDPITIGRKPGLSPFNRALESLRDETSSTTNGGQHCRGPIRVSGRCPVERL